jgi:hypothetical protein
MIIVMRITNHRRFTANHTWHVDRAGLALFVKANPHQEEAHAECAGHAHLREFYPVPRLRGARRGSRWTVLVYDRWPYLARDSGLLLDEITHADLTDDRRSLDACLADVFSQYQRVIARTLRPVSNRDTIRKLYGDRAATNGRLDRYYRHNEPWPIGNGTERVRPSDLAALRLVVNGREHAVDFFSLMIRLQAHFDQHGPVWAAITQGDPTDVNIGWSPAGGPVWFDYDAGGLNAIAGEIACFLLYQRLHGAWLTPRYNTAAFRDHPSALASAVLAEPVVRVEHDRSCLVINYLHRPSRARRHVLRRYLDEIVRPIACSLDIDDLMAWLRPYLVMRLLAVYYLADLEQRDAALSLALLAQVLDPATELPDFLALTSAQSSAC